MTKTNKIEILENGIIQVRELEQLELKDGSIIDGGYHRKVLTPDMDLESIECEKCKAVASTVWTEEVISEYKASIEANEI